MGWPEFLQEYNIPWKRGSGNNVNLSCPFCGPSDRKMKMTVSTVHSGYNCWRANDHRGWDPANLICELLKINYQSAESISDEYFKNVPGSPSINYTKRPTVAKLEFPEEFEKFGSDNRYENQFIDYLLKRKLDPKFMINRFGLRWSMGEHYRGRIIIPIYFQNELKTWTSRTISKNCDIKYKACPAEICGHQPFDFLYDADNLHGSDLLIVCEGFFDMAKITSSFIPGIEATATCGKKISEKQISLLKYLSEYYRKIVISLDPDAKKDRMDMIDHISWVVPNLAYIECPEEDWGSMSTVDIKRVFSHV